MNDLFEHTESIEEVAKLKLPRIVRPSRKCLADYDTQSERQKASQAMQNRSIRQMERDRILAARAEVKHRNQQTKRKCKSETR